MTETSAAPQAAKLGSAKGVRPAPVVVEKFFQFLLWLLPTVEGYPKTLKFSLGERTVERALDLHETLVSAAYSGQPAPLLQAVNLQLSQLRHLLRLAHGLQALDHRRFEFAAHALDECGRMIGGWQKHLAGRR